MIGSKKSGGNKNSLIAIVSSDQAYEEIQQIAAQLDKIQSSVKKTEDTLRDAAKLVNGSADVVIIEADLANPDSDAVLKQLCQYVSQKGSLIVLAENATPATTRAMFKAGVNDVLSLPLDRQDLLQSLESAFGALVDKQQGFRPAGKVITFMKCGGGAGSTTLATNVANYLMTGGKTKKSKSEKSTMPLPTVAVFDFDVQFGTVAVSLNVEGRSTILDARRAEDRLDSSLLASAMLHHKSGLNILASPDEIVPFTAFNSDFIEQIIDIGRAMFDYVIIDMPHAWTSWTHTVADHSDVIVPVLKANVEQVHNVQKVLIGLDHLKISREKSLLAVNHVPKGMSTNERIAQIKKITKRPVAVIHEDTKTNMSARDRGAMLSEISTKSATTKDIAKCAEQILKHLSNQNTVSAPILQTGDSDLSLHL
jgi:pilus assembly protein CpaE